MTRHQEETMRFIAIAVTLLTTVWLAEPALRACGDKFLSVSRGTRFQRAGLARRPAAILVLAPQGGRLAASVQALGVIQALTKAGYTPVLVSDATPVTPAVQGRAWDLVIRDLDAAPALVGLTGAPSQVVIAWDVPRDAVSRARKDFDAVVVRPSRVRAVIDAVDDALLTRTLRPAATARAGN